MPVVFERIDEQFKQERYVVAVACLADALDEITLAAVDGRVGIGRYQARTLTASAPMRLILATDQSSITLDIRPPRPSWKTESSSVTIRPFVGDRRSIPRGTA